MNSIAVPTDYTSMGQRMGAAVGNIPIAAVGAYQQAKEFQVKQEEAGRVKEEYTRKKTAWEDLKGTMREQNDIILDDLKNPKNLDGLSANNLALLERKMRGYEKTGDYAGWEKYTGNFLEAYDAYKKKITENPELRDKVPMLPPQIAGNDKVTEKYKQDLDQFGVLGKAQEAIAGGGNKEDMTGKFVTGLPGNTPISAALEGKKVIEGASISGRYEKQLNELDQAKIAYYKQRAKQAAKGDDLTFVRLLGLIDSVIDTQGKYSGMTGRMLGLDDNATAILENVVSTAEKAAGIGAKTKKKPGGSLDLTPPPK